MGFVQHYYKIKLRLISKSNALKFKKCGTIFDNEKIKQPNPPVSQFHCPTQFSHSSSPTQAFSSVRLNADIEKPLVDMVFFANYFTFSAWKCGCRSTENWQNTSCSRAQAQQAPHSQEGGAVIWVSSSCAPQNFPSRIGGRTHGQTLMALKIV